MASLYTFFPRFRMRNLLTKKNLDKAWRMFWVLCGTSTQVPVRLNLINWILESWHQLPVVCIYISITPYFLMPLTIPAIHCQEEGGWQFIICDRMYDELRTLPEGTGIASLCMWRNQGSGHCCVFGTRGTAKQFGSTKDPPTFKIFAKLFINSLSS